MSIEIKCDCGAEYRLEDHRGGQEFICKICSASMHVPVGVPRATPGQIAEVAAPATAVVTAAAPAAPSAATGDTSSPTMGQTLGGPAVAQPTPGPNPPADAAPPPPTAWSPAPAWADPSVEAHARPSDRHPPQSWWALRFIMWGMCVGFLFVPWFTISAKQSPAGPTVSQSLTGWQIVKATADGISASARHAGGGVPTGVDMGQMPEGVASILAGTLMLVAGPCVYAAGLLVAVVIAWVVHRCDGKGAAWPFVVCWIGLLTFIVGWKLIASCEPVSQLLEASAKTGASIGASGWAYLMLLVLIPMCMIARSRPDHELDRVLARRPEAH